MSEQPNGAGQRIVVGVDGSPSSREALRWAIRQARLTGASVEAVTAWRSSSAARLPEVGDMAEPFAQTALGETEESRARDAAASTLRAAIAEEAGQSPAVQVKGEVGEGPPAQVLLDAAKGASLLVVGSRGLGGVAGTLLGSVGQTLAQQSPCPVLIIRGAE